VNKPRRVFYNDDGDGVLLSYKGTLRPEMATDSVDVLLGTPITTLVLCVSCSDTVTFPSEIVSMYAWRDTPSRRSSASFWHTYQFFNQVREQGWDIPKMILERAEEKGLEFIPSMRMNDAHYGIGVHPTENPNTGEFWMEHQDLIIEPEGSWPEYYQRRGHLLDFRHEAVRDFRLASAIEIIDRYGKYGFEMDWTRHPVFFLKGKEQPELITDMVRKVRARLDERGREQGRRLPLIMRVRAGIEESLQTGLDARTWIAEGLADYIVPSSQSRYIAFDMPMCEWMELAAGTPVEIHVSPDSASPRGDGNATLEMYRAAASNYFAMGVDGFYLFNLFCRGYPLEDDAYLIMRDVADPDTLSRRDKLFMASLDNWRPDTDTLPVSLSDPNRAARIGLMVGDDLALARRSGTLRGATLRVRVDRILPEDRLEITLNDTKLDLKEAVVDMPDKPALKRWKLQTGHWTYEAKTLNGPWAWIEFELKDVLPRKGDNLVTVRSLVAPAADREIELTLTDVDLAVSYNFCGTGCAP